MVSTKEQKIVKLCSGDNLTQKRKFNGRFVSSIALMLTVYGSKSYMQDDEKILFVEGVNFVYKRLKNFFVAPDDNVTPETTHAEINDKQTAQLTNEPIAGDNQPYFACVSRYLQTQERLSENSLYQRVAGIEISEPKVCRTFMENQRQDVKKAAVTMKLRKFYKQYCQRVPQISKLTKPSKSPRKHKSTMTLPKYCDRGVQCSKGSEFLKVSSDSKFSSRSCLVVNVGEPQEKASLEYVANYRSEFPKDNYDDGVPKLKSFSCSTIFGLDGGRRDALRNDYVSLSPRKIKLTRRARRASDEQLQASMKRAENDIFKYSSFIEDDLVGFRNRPSRHLKYSRSHHNLERNDIFTVKKILLEDYITEVKEIIRAEAQQYNDTQILDNVRKRLDEDVALGANTESWHSLPESNTSYSSAVDDPITRKSSWRCCCYDSDYHSDDTPRHCKSCCPKIKDKLYSSTSESCSTDDESKHSHSQSYPKKLQHNDPAYRLTNRTSLKSSHSVDSGVYSHRRDWRSSDESSCGSIIGKNADFEIEKKSTDSSMLSEMSSEELCSRVESAVKKFTEELVICERKARSRSKRLRRSRETAESSSQTHCGNCCCLRRDEERAAGASTASLVSE